MPFADQIGTDAPSACLILEGALPADLTSQSECAAYQRSRVDWQKFGTCLLGASTNARVLPFGDHDGSKEMLPSGVGTGVHTSLAAEQISTLFVSHAYRFGPSVNANIPFDPMATVFHPTVTPSFFGRAPGARIS